MQIHKNEEQRLVKYKYKYAFDPSRGHPQMVFRDKRECSQNSSDWVPSKVAVPAPFT